jgi:hypothetical protein
MRAAIVLNFDPASRMNSSNPGQEDKAASPISLTDDESARPAKSDIPRTPPWRCEQIEMKPQKPPGTNPEGAAPVEEPEDKSRRFL